MDAGSSRSSGTARLSPPSSSAVALGGVEVGVGAHDRGAERGQPGGHGGADAAAGADDERPPPVEPEHVLQCIHGRSLADALSVRGGRRSYGELGFRRRCASRGRSGGVPDTGDTSWGTTRARSTGCIRTAAADVVTSAVRRRGHAPGAALVVDDVTVRFGGIVALDQVRLEARAGRDHRSHRPQRRRQDDAVQLPHRHLPGRSPGASAGTTTSCSACRRTRWPRADLADVPEPRLFPRLTVRENVIVGSPVRTPDWVSNAVRAPWVLARRSGCGPRPTPPSRRSACRRSPGAPPPGCRTAR